ncbi:lysozyme-like protein, partial [Basidiobolus meristosporus CBS 931.73]
MILNIPFGILVVALMPAVRGGEKFCQKEYANTKENCSKFSFTSTQCKDTQSNERFYDLAGWVPAEISEEGKLKAQILTNVFENGSPVFGYPNCEILGDKRGYTCGRVGFTTGTGDALAVIDRYTGGQEAYSPFAKYTKRLQELDQLSLCDNRRNDTTGLEGFDKVWIQAACRDPRFRHAQDAVNDEMYFTPAMKFAGKVLLETNIGKAVFYDTIVQHGWQVNEDQINIVQIMKLTGPRGNMTEVEYLEKFLSVRRQMLCCYPDHTWPQSADRISDLQSVLKDKVESNDLNLAMPIKLPNYGAVITGKEYVNKKSKLCKV